MVKSDLRNGDIVELRNGNRMIVVGERFLDLDGFMPLSTYKLDLTNIRVNLRSKDWDVMKVYRTGYFGQGIEQLLSLEAEHMELIWGRKEFSFLPREIEILKALKTIGYVHIKKGDLYVKVGDGNSFYYTTDEVDGLFNNLKLYEEYEIEDLLK